MDIDVASKLFPNLTTMIVQLLSTGVMFFCFKRFLWKYVQAYLGKRADFIEGNMQEAKAMNDKAKAMLLESEEKARQSALEYQQILASAKEDAQKQQEAPRRSLGKRLIFLKRCAPFQSSFSGP